jgi:hypothetical protein
VIGVEGEGGGVEESVEGASDVSLACTDVNDVDLGWILEGKAGRKEIGDELGHARDFMLFFERDAMEFVGDGYGESYGIPFELESVYRGEEGLVGVCIFPPRTGKIVGVSL